VVPAASVADGPGWQTSDWVVGMRARSGEGGFEQDDVRAVAQVVEDRGQLGVPVASGHVGLAQGRS